MHYIACTNGSSDGCNAVRDALQRGVHSRKPGFHIWKARRQREPQMAATMSQRAGTGVATPPPRMTGVITTRHLLTHGVLIVRQFGLRTYLSCVYRVMRHPGTPCTFLGSIY